MCWTRGNSTADSPGWSGLRSTGGSPSRRAPPLHPKTPRNGEASVAGGAIGFDVRWFRATGCSNFARHRKRLCFTTWSSAVVKAASGRKSLRGHALSTRRPIPLSGPLTAVVKRCSVFGVRFSESRGAGCALEGCPLRGVGRDELRNLLSSKPGAPWDPAGDE